MAEGTQDREEYIPLPPGMDARWLAREGVNVLLNAGVQSAEQLFRKFKRSNPLIAAGGSLVDFITAAMTFEDEKMDQAVESLRKTEKMCNVDNLFDGFMGRKSSDRFSPEERIERMIISADCELFMAFLMFLKQSVVDFVKAGYHMRRAWKMYERCHTEVHGQSFLSNGNGDDGKGTPRKKSSRPKSPCNLSPESLSVLDSALSFGYGLIQVAISIVPSGLLRVCELLGFQADRELGLKALETCSRSEDMKAPIARLTLLWYHTVVRPFCALDGNNLEAGLNDASVILEEVEPDYPRSAIFLYFRALVLRLRGQLDQALDVLDKAMLSATDQREIALLCHYDQGWCHMMRLEWDLATKCFTRLRQESKWSESYYTYLQALSIGAFGNTKEAYQCLRMVPKLVVRKTQLETFLLRKAQLYKRSEPTDHEFFLLALELLYLWNALPQCGQRSLEQMLRDLEKCSNPVMQPLKLLIMGSIHSLLHNNDVAMQYFHVASSKTDGKLSDTHVIPYALYELAILYLEKEESSQSLRVQKFLYQAAFCAKSSILSSSSRDSKRTKAVVGFMVGKTVDRGKNLLQKVKDNYKDYDFENRLNFRVHAALNGLRNSKS